MYNEMIWTSVYRAHFGDISGPRAKAWEEMIENKVKPTPSGAEITAAVENLAKGMTGDEEGGYLTRKPTIGKLISTIYFMRGQGKRAEDLIEMDRRKLDAEKRIRLAAKDGKLEDVWEIICENDTTIEECEQRSDYAKSIGVDVIEMKRRVKERCQFQTNRIKIKRTSNYSIDNQR
jgi:hypothetical protein